MNLPRRLPPLADGLGLACLGGFLLGLAGSPYYWHFLNPKYESLTALTGALLVLAGLYMALAGDHGGRRPGRLSAVAVVLALGLLAYGSIEREPDEQGFSLDVDAPEAAPGAPESLVELGGKTYVRMNVIEAAMLARERPEDLPERIAVRGLAVRLPGGEWAVGRVYVICCLADAVGVSLVVTGPGAETMEPGWVEVAGSIVPLPGPVPDTGPVTIPLTNFLVVHDEIMIRAEHVRPTPEASPPFIFEVREGEPFAF